MPLAIELAAGWADTLSLAAIAAELDHGDELLSPANKRTGLDGADAFEKKRQEIFSSTAHLIEIDLLRAGARPQVAPDLTAAAAWLGAHLRERGLRG